MHELGSTFTPERPRSDRDLVDLFLAALEFRADHPEWSSRIAETVFDATFPGALNFVPRATLLRLRDEYGALEAPGDPDDSSMTLRAHENGLWARLAKKIELEAGREG